MTYLRNLSAHFGAKLAKRLPPERAHRAAITGLKLGLGPKSKFRDPVLRTHIAGLDLPNPIGLAAGFDKDAEAPDAMLAAGFGFAEMGSVTPKPQAGNPQPRLFRLSADKAVINRMGFNNHGLAGFAANLKARKDKPGIVGANLGANKDAADRTADYIKGLERLWGLANYFTINISSPNTPGLRKLQGADALVYLKPPVPFYGADHYPEICWRAGGYAIRAPEKVTIAGMEMMMARLETEEEQLYTAWWYSNGEVHTVSTFDWRWRQLKGEPAFFLTNVTAGNRTELECVLGEYLALEK